MGESSRNPTHRQIDGHWAPSTVIVPLKREGRGNSLSHYESFTRKQQQILIVTYIFLFMTFGWIVNWQDASALFFRVSESNPDELTRVPINRASRFDNKVGSLNVVAGDSLIKKRILEILHRSSGWWIINQRVSSHHVGLLPGRRNEIVAHRSRSHASDAAMWGPAILTLEQR